MTNDEQIGRWVTPAVAKQVLNLTPSALYHRIRRGDLRRRRRDENTREIWISAPRSTWEDAGVEIPRKRQTLGDIARARAAAAKKRNKT